jgi:hypothetical protein
MRDQDLHVQTPRKRGALRKSFVPLIAAVFLVAVMAVAPASAARQNGLVNINIEDNIVQVPIGIAANVCDVNAAVLAAIVDTGDTECDAESEVLAGATITDADNTGGGTVQNGLVNVNVEGNAVQVPIAAAANICDVNLAVLIAFIADHGETSCTAKSGALSETPTPTPTIL